MEVPRVLSKVFLWVVLEFPVAFLAIVGEFYPRDARSLPLLIWVMWLFYPSLVFALFILRIIKKESGKPRENKE